LPTNTVADKIFAPQPSKEDTNQTVPQGETQEESQQVVSVEKQDVNTEKSVLEDALLEIRKQFAAEADALWNKIQQANAKQDKNMLLRLADLLQHKQFQEDLVKYVSYWEEKFQIKSS
jgi:hypothetical protein